MDTNLSTRETQVLRLVAAGMTTKEIAVTLSIAESTVNWHVGNALAKLGASSRAEAVAIMLRDGPPEAPVVLVRPRRRPVGRLAAAAVAALLLAAAGGTSAAAYVLASRPSVPRPPDAAPAATEPAVPATAAPPSRPSPDGRTAPASPTASATASASRVGAPAPASTSIAPPVRAPATIAPISIPPVPTPTFVPTLPGLVGPAPAGLPSVPILPGGSVLP